jgi:hypothetical protein
MIVARLEMISAFVHYVKVRVSECIAKTVRNQSRCEILFHVLAVPHDGFFNGDLFDTTKHRCPLSHDGGNSHHDKS